MDGPSREAMTALVKNPHGLILFTGPTGSGKTTTLYASLMAINSDEINVMTVEDRQPLYTRQREVVADLVRELTAGAPDVLEPSFAEAWTRAAGEPGAGTGSGTEAIEPIIVAGAGRRPPSTERRVARASSASVRFEAMTSGQPPGRSDPTKSIAEGTASQGVGSHVPVQSNSARKRPGAGSGEKPWLATVGRTDG